MNIQWYPGHMTKTRRQIEADLKNVDIVVEIIDARIPISSRNPDIDAICAGKPRLIRLTPPRTRPGGSGSGSVAVPCWRPTPRPEREWASSLR